MQPSLIIRFPWNLLDSQNSQGHPVRNEHALYLNYVLTTANTWNGPIGTFHLTIDKGAPRNVLSLCMDGSRKTGPTTFEVEKKNFSPAQDLCLLIVTELEGQ